MESPLQEQSENAVFESLSGTICLLRYWAVFSAFNPLHLRGIVLMLIDEQLCIKSTNKPYVKAGFTSSRILKSGNRADYINSHRRLFLACLRH
ncbi:unnamed protein product [Microthlaspi erraticum]|uniref:Uncharacterized protein n=1 Tax=Microthlaspi erraticum TaxID=1685480 RepID=A0A6D2JHI4_9BRAS|nr:unnamed protein product [Microthlaspi erraticum]